MNFMQRDYARAFVRIVQTGDEANSPHFASDLVRYLQCHGLCVTLKAVSPRKMELAINNKEVSIQICEWDGRTDKLWAFANLKMGTKCRGVRFNILRTLQVPDKLCTTNDHGYVVDPLAFLCTNTWFEQWPRLTTVKWHRRGDSQGDITVRYMSEEACCSAVVFLLNPTRGWEMPQTNKHPAGVKITMWDNWSEFDIHGVEDDDDVVGKLA